MQAAYKCMAKPLLLPGLKRMTEGLGFTQQHHGSGQMSLYAPPHGMDA